MGNLDDLKYLVEDYDNQVKKLENFKENLAKSKLHSSIKKKVFEFVKSIKKSKDLEELKKRIERVPIDMEKLNLKEYEGEWVTKKEFQKLREIELGLEDNFSKMSGYEFEDFIANLFKKMGYRVVDIKNSGDEGVDLMAYKGRKKISIQTKRWKKGLARSREVQIALGTLVSHKATRSIIITTSKFTRDALKLAKKNKKVIELWDKEKFHDMVRKYFM